MRCENIEWFIESCVSEIATAVIIDAVKFVNIVIHPTPVVTLNAASQFSHKQPANPGNSIHRVND